MGLLGKLRTAARIAREEGARGVWRTALARAEQPWLHELLGWWTDLRGRPVTLQGVRVPLDHPRISRAQRGYWRLHGAAYEVAEKVLIERWLRRDLPLIELGGCLGVVSVLSNRLLVDPSAHLVVEADPSLAAVIEATRDREQARFKVLSGAIGYDGPTVRLRFSPRFFLGSSLHAINETLSDTTVEVSTVSVAQLADAHGFQRFCLVCDIEGAEHDLLAHEHEVLAERVEVVVMELHDTPEHQAAEALRRLLGLGFRLAETMDSVVALERESAAR